MLHTTVEIQPLLLLCKHIHVTDGWELEDRWNKVCKINKFDDIDVQEWMLRACDSFHLLLRLDAMFF